MSLLVIITLGAVLLILGVAALVMLNAARTRGSIARSLDLTLLSFELPRYSAPAQGQSDAPRFSIGLVSR